MVSSTVAFAVAANYPAPFLQSGAADVAVVYGSKAASTDLVAVTDITAKLQAELAKQTATPSTTGGVSASGGDFVKIETSSEKLNIGENLTQVRTTIIGATDMPSLLKKLTYQTKTGVSSDYEQEILLAPGTTFTLFGDIDYKDRTPTLGIAKSSNSPLLNYTARFVKTIESDVDSNGRLKDIENTDITLLGKNYKLLNAYNTSATALKLELMGGAVSDIITLDESKTYTIGNTTYNIKLTFVDTTSAKFEINGETTPKMAAGATQKLKDGTQVGVREVLFQNFAGGVMKVEFSLGAEKITIENGQKLRLNDEQVNDVTTYQSVGNTGSKRTITSLTLAWVPNDKYFITESKPATFPGLKALTISMGNFTTPSKETISLVNSGDKSMVLKANIKSGDVTIPILYGNGTAITKIGEESSNGILRTTNDTKLIFNRTTDRQFVASWTSGTNGTGTAAESYLLRALTNRDVPSTGINSTDIIDSKSGSVLCDDKTPTQTCTIGNVVLTIQGVDVDVDGAVNITAGSNVVFNKLYTTSGFKISLPFPVPTGNIVTPVPGAINGSQLNETNNNPLATFTFVGEEENKDHNLGLGQSINATVSWTAGKIEVSSVANGNKYASGTSMTNLDVGGSTTTSKYVNYIVSDLGTKLTYDTKPDQNNLEIEYYGGQSYGSVFLTSPSVTIGVSGGSAGGVKELGSVSVVDSEVASVAGKNLIVVGGSCVNSVAADLLGGALCGAAFEAKTGVGAGSFLIETFARSGGKVATLVAGYNAADTSNAGKYITTQTIDTMVGKKYTGTSATSASLVTA